jgi:hypothetical protein
MQDSFRGMQRMHYQVALLAMHGIFSQVKRQFQ